MDPPTTTAPNSGEYELDVLDDIEAGAPSRHHAKKNVEDSGLRATSLFIIGALLGATTVALAHHTFLSHVDGHPIDAKSQFWIRNANNALSTIVRSLLGLSITSSMVQTVRFRLK